MTLLIIFFVFSISISFLCSLWEAVLLSITPSHSKGLIQDGNKTGRIVEDLKKDIDRPLSAILTLNTTAHTVGAMGVGSQAGKLWGTNYIDILGFNLSYESIVATLMTLAILIFSEIIPKTLGANNWKALTGFTANSLRLLIIVLMPLVWMSQLITRSLKKNKDEAVLTRSDFKAMAVSVEESGELQKSEFKIIKNLLGFEELTAADIMTPRTVMVMAEENETIQNYYNSVNKQMPYSRIPLYSESHDNVTGQLLKDDLLQQLVEGNGHKKLKDIKRPITAVLKGLTLPFLFEKLVQKNNHQSIVVDEYGMIQGLVTMEDLIETLFGREIMDESDNITDLQAYAREQWEKKSKDFDID